MIFKKDNFIFGLALGFQAVFSGPLVRSSYMADLVSEEAQRKSC